MDFQARQPDEIINAFKKKFKFKFKFSPYIIAIAVIFLISFIRGTFYTIQPNEIGVVLRFGKFVRNTDPGLHFKLPFSIEQVYPVPVESIDKEEFGFRTRSAGVTTSYDRGSYESESIMLTGDLNVLDLEWVVQFRRRDPVKILFNVRDLRKTLRDISESVMRKVVGDYTFNEVLTEKRVEINTIVQEEMQKILDQYESGIAIITVKLQDVNPPDPVKPAFNEVNEAKQEREKLINQAWEIYNQKIPQAKGEALKLVKEAEGYSLEKINNSEGDAKRFLLLYEAYAKAKDVTRKRLYLEQMSKIFAKTGKKYIIDPKEKGILPLLKLENE